QMKRLKGIYEGGGLVDPIRYVPDQKYLPKPTPAAQKLIDEIIDLAESVTLLTRIKEAEGRMLKRQFEKAHRSQKQADDIKDELEENGPYWPATLQKVIDRANQQVANVQKPGEIARREIRKRNLAVCEEQLKILLPELGYTHNRWDLAIRMPEVVKETQQAVNKRMDEALRASRTRGRTALIPRSQRQQPPGQGEQPPGQGQQPPGQGPQQPGQGQQPPGQGQQPEGQGQQPPGQGQQPGQGEQQPGQGQQQRPVSATELATRRFAELPPEQKKQITRSFQDAPEDWDSDLGSTLRAGPSGGRTSQPSMSQQQEQEEQQEQERKAIKLKEHTGLARGFFDRRGPKKEKITPTDRPLEERTWLGRLRIRLLRRFQGTTLEHRPFGRIRKGTPYIKDGVLRKHDFFDLQEFLMDEEEVSTKRDLPRLERMQLFFNRVKELLGTSQELDRNHLFRPVPVPVMSDYTVRKIRAHVRAERLRPLFQLRQQYSVKRLPRQRLRSYYKKFHSIRQSMAFRQAWWDKVLPQVRADLNVQFQHQQNSLLKRRYDTLSDFEIVKRNNEATEKKIEKLSLVSPQESRTLSSSERRKAEAEKIRNGINKIPLEIGDFDSKPLAMPAAIKLRKKAMLKLRLGSSSGLSKRGARLVKNAKKPKELVLSSSHPPSSPEGGREEERIKERSSDKDAAKEDQMKSRGPFNSETNVTSNPSLSAEVSEVAEVSLPNSELRSSSLSSSGKRGNGVTNKRPKDVISQVLEATLLNENKTTPVGNKHALIPTTSIPFYAGWDESLRKFVVTNRLLTRRDADSELRIRNNYDSRLSKLINIEPELGKITNVQFTSPIRGMAAGTAFAIAVPFGVYDTEQFFSVGHDGFAPIGWRRFAFRQTLLKTWLYQRATNKLNPKSAKRRKPRSKVIVRNKTTILNKTKPMKVISKLNYKIDEKVNPLFRATPIFNKKGTDLLLKNRNSRFRTRLVRYRTKITKVPNVSVLPSLGPRLADVLPLQYTQIFFVGDRTFDDMTIKRHLREDFPENVTLSNPSPRFVPDFTLRQLVKPIRVFHIKNELGHSYEDPYVIPRRVKFLRYKSDPMRWRPIGAQLLEGVSITDFIKDIRKSRAINLITMRQPVPVENLEQEEKKQRLPVRAAQQIVRNVQRIEHREGGLVWDDDYLRLVQ
ncbi:MAG: hypothetical protein NT027_03375, partial [Proteobacteria bacterium]|nr:hypothetical protein [Pseudomonadota bacterium]